MAKIESSFKNMVLSLTLISLGASIALGFVHEFTKEPIELSKLNKKIEAIKKVVLTPQEDHMVRRWSS